MHGSSMDKASGDLSSVVNTLEGVPQARNQNKHTDSNHYSFILTSIPHLVCWREWWHTLAPLIRFLSGEGTQHTRQVLNV